MKKRKKLTEKTLRASEDRQFTGSRIFSSSYSEKFGDGV
jgi:hypothetical protein